MYLLKVLTQLCTKGQHSTSAIIRKPGINFIRVYKSYSKQTGNNFLHNFTLWFSASPEMVTFITLHCDSWLIKSAEKKCSHKNKN